MPSSSARCAQLPRAADKVPFYQALKKFKDYLNGLISELDDSEITFTESKCIVKVPSLQNGDTSVGMRGQVGEDKPGHVQSTEKKKRGRPRKGMEKQPVKDKKEKESRALDSERQDEFRINELYGTGFGPNDTSTNPRLQDAQKKRRGRPKKPKLSGSPPPGTIGTTTPPDTLENNTQNSIGTCQTQTASSVSSGYSTATNASSEDRRREENGSLSNTGSGGPSPSHHSFTTQSDLSSEISAAISCGSPQSSPLNNNQSDSVFDPHARDPHSGSKMQSSSSSIQNAQNHTSQTSMSCRAPMNPFNSPQGQQGHSNTPHLESHGSESYAQLAYYDNRPSSLGNNRAQNFQSPVNNQRGKA